MYDSQSSTNYGQQPYQPTTGYFQQQQAQQQAQQQQPLLYQPQPVYQQQPYQPQQPYQTTYQTVVCQQPKQYQNSNEDTGALIVLIVGLFVPLVWIGGFFYLRSKSRTAKVCGIISVVGFFLALALTIILVSVFVAAAAEIAHEANNYNYSSSYYYSN